METNLLEQPRANEDLAEPGDHQFVTLMLGRQLCGIPVLEVRDVLGEQVISRVPLAPTEVAGSLNLRGRIVTAIDLRLRLGLPPAAPGARRMSVVVDVTGELYALLVDQVAEVVRPPASVLERNPPTLPPSWADVSRGIYQLEDRLLVVLDVGRLLALSNAPEY